MNRSRTNDRLATDEEDRQPLLDDEDRVTGKSSSKVVFSADDDDDDDDDAEYYEPPDPHAEGDAHPRSGPPLRSTIQSREARESPDSSVSVCQI
ncbi:hypothetical protein M407DRAFT_112194 [Tulasnella calospora MUT 4182]|uniref:Uncharacterized protein n=1 Tax=Tulasnella calospora MUT 4182 TaxID=1051891 RepID=A0A0C3QUT8_9AGAM|nr:hypothetical protein M407DRAFT_112194 [Tulasnella calospora MUT 4182]